MPAPPRPARLPLGPQRRFDLFLLHRIHRAAISLTLHYSSPAIPSHYFPWPGSGDTSSDLFRSSYLDLPETEPELIALGMKQIQVTFRKIAAVVDSHIFQVRIAPAVKDESRILKAAVAKYQVLHLIGSNLVGGPEKQILHHAQDMQDSEYQLSIGSFHDLKESAGILAAAEQRQYSHLVPARRRAS